MRTLVLGLVITSLVMCFSPAGKAIRGDEALKVYYPFDEGKGNEVKDHSGNENTGTIEGKGVEWVKNGKIGGAISFDGKSGGFVKTPPEIEGLTNVPLTEITIECWINLQGTTGDIMQLVEGHTNGWEIFIEGRQEMIWLVTDDANVRIRAQTAPIPLKEWHHIAGTVDASELRLYLDGKLVQKSTWRAGKFTIKPLGFAIGRDLEANIQYFNGLVDEFAIYNRCLKEEEIKQDMEKGVAAAVSPSDKLTTVWGRVKMQ